MPRGIHGSAHNRSIDSPVILAYLSMQGFYILTIYMNSKQWNKDHAWGQTGLRTVRWSYF